MEADDERSTTSKRISLPALETTTERAQKVLSAPNILTSEAIKAASRLVKQWPHANPPSLEIWLTALAAALADYPAAVVAECIDPRMGLARVREFPPTVASIVMWCEARMAQYRGNATPFNDKLRWLYNYWKSTGVWVGDLDIFGPAPDMTGTKVTKEMIAEWSQQQ